MAYRMIDGGVDLQQFVRPFGKSVITSFPEIQHSPARKCVGISAEEKMALGAVGKGVIGVKPGALVCPAYVVRTVDSLPAPWWIISAAILTGEVHPAPDKQTKEFVTWADLDGAHV